MGLAAKLLIVLLAAIGLCAGAYLAGYRAAHNAGEAEKVAAVARAIAQATALARQNAAIGAGYEAHRARTRIVYRTLTREVIKYVDTHPRIHTCGLDADGLRLWRAANAGDTAALPGGAHGALPGAAAAGQRRPGGAAQKPRRGGASLPRLPGAPGGAGAVRGQQEQK